MPVFNRQPTTPTIPLQINIPVQQPQPVNLPQQVPQQPKPATDTGGDFFVGGGDSSGSKPPTPKSPSRRSIILPFPTPLGGQ